jgi:exodeoxyribonuclease VII small subunit
MAKENLQNALHQLEKIVEDLNKKDIDIETGLKKFKDGVELIKLCRNQLQKAENEFKKLKNELDFEIENDKNNNFDDESWQ